MIELFANFIAITSFILLFTKNFIFGFTFLILFVFLIKIHKIKKRNFYIVLLCEIIFILVIILLSKTKFLYGQKIIGLVIRKSENYIILWNGLSKFYLKITDQNIDFLDILSVEGSFEEFYFSSIENDFNFNSYLNNQGVFYKISQNSYKIIFNNPINIFYIQNLIINRFQNTYSNYLISLLLFGKQNDLNDSTIEIYNLAKILNSGGIYIYFANRIIYKVLNKKLDDKKSEVLSFVFLAPFFLLNLNRFTVIRYIFMKITRLINKYKLNKKFENLDILSLTSSFFLIINPYTLFNQSFFISYLISYFMNFTDLLLKKYKGIKLSFIKKIFVLLLILPFNFKTSNSINILTLFLSIFSHEIMKPIFLFSLIFLILPPLKIIDNSLGFIISILEKISFKNFSIAVPHFSQLFYIFYYLIIILLIYFKEVNFEKIFKKINIFAMILSLLYIMPFTNYFYNEISFINVGQGDCSLIKYHDTTILIDTGGLTYCDTATTSIIPYLRNLKIYDIDAVFITHSDYDHCGAFDSLNKNFKIKNAYTYEDNFPIKINNLEFENLNIYWDEQSEENDKSLVLKLNLNYKTFLFMGDATKDIESLILKNNPNLTCDILKVGHHGSSSSSSEKFIKAIKPKEAVISCGYNNKYHHPNDSVIQILEKYNINIRRTDIEGTIKYKFYG